MSGEERDLGRSIEELALGEHSEEPRGGRAGESGAAEGVPEDLVARTLEVLQARAKDRDRDALRGAIG